MEEQHDKYCDCLYCEMGPEEYGEYHAQLAEQEKFIKKASKTIRELRDPLYERSVKVIVNKGIDEHNKKIMDEFVRQEAMWGPRDETPPYHPSCLCGVTNQVEGERK